MHHMLPLVSHDLGMLLGRLVDLHLVATLASLTLALLLLLEQLVFALTLEVDAAVLRHLILFDIVLGLDLAFSTLDTVHSRILLVNGFGGAVCLSRAGTLNLLLLLCQLLSAVIITVGDQIGFGLLGGKLCGSRVLGIPVK